ncbi:MAG: polyprenyl synthetase family protein [Anaerolineae bacterium]|nr:polyprenyl synthetase family protein [Anaerolineae bacterium]
MSTINQIVAKYAADIDNTIKRLVNETPPFMRGIIGYHFGWMDENFQPTTSKRGKMLRPVISLLVYEAITGNYQDALPVAASIEIIHNFSLLHDDIEDNDVERRGRPTAWTIWGQPAVINAGDHLYSLAYKALYQLDPAKIAPERIFAVLRVVNEACLRLTEGQDLDLKFETIQNVSTGMYLDMVYKKTGALIEAAILAGARLATADEDIIQNYSDFAHNIGLAFQIRDDVLGIWGDSKQTGKSAVNDLRRKKKTLPVIYMLDQIDGARQKKLEAYYATPEPLSAPEIEFVRECLALVEAQHYAQGVADNYKQKSFAALAKIGASNQAQSDLRTMTEFLINRLY